MIIGLLNFALSMYTEIFSEPRLEPEASRRLFAVESLPGPPKGSCVSAIVQGLY